MMTPDYEEGWKAHGEFLADRATANSAGSAFSTISFGFTIYGFVAVGAVAIWTMQTGWNHILHPFTEIVLGLGLLMIAVSIVGHRTAASHRERGHDAFLEKWGTDVVGSDEPREKDV